MVGGFFFEEQLVLLGYEAECQDSFVFCFMAIILAFLTGNCEKKVTELYAYGRVVRTK